MLKVEQKFLKLRYSLRHLLYTFFTFFLSGLLIFSPAYAASCNIPIQEYAVNNILFYEPCDDCANGYSYTAKPTGSQITWIGDSYSAIAQMSYNMLEKNLPGVDLGPGNYNTPQSYIQGSKFFASGSDENPSGISILENIVKSGNLREYLIFALGTNGGMSGWGDTDYFQKVLDLAGSNTKVVFVTTRTLNGDKAPTTTGAMYDKFNDALRNFASKHNNVYVADWDKTVGDDIYKYFSDSDGIHPKDEAGYKAWYDTIYDALPGGSVGTLPGNNNAEKIWNYFANAGIAGVSDNPAVISAFLGNFYAESSLYPFPNSSCIGLFQVCESSGQKQAFLDYMARYGLDYYSLASQSSIPSDINDLGISVQMQFLAEEYHGLDSFISHLNIVSSPTPESYAELFVVIVERAVCYPGMVAAGRECHDFSQPLQDQNIINYVKNDLYPSGTYHAVDAYQGVATRREKSREYFDLYAGASAQAIVSSLNVSTGMTWSDGWLSGMPGLIIQDVTGYSDLNETLRPGYTTADNKPNKILLHSTEGTSNGYNAYPAGNKYPAHFIIDLKKQETYQNLPITNRALSTSGSDGSSVQIEIVGFSTPANSNSPYYLQSFTATEWDYLVVLLSAISEETGIPLTTPVDWNIQYGGNENAIRATDKDDFNNNVKGVVGHMHSAGDNHIDPGNIWPMIEAAIARNPTAAQFANGALTARCGIGNVVISEGGLTYDQAIVLMKNYGANKNNSTSNAISGYWNLCQPGGHGSNCVSFSAFFLKKFTNVNNGELTELPDGHAVVDRLANRYNVSVGTAPQVWSVFSWSGGEFGHTGVILGYHDGKYIVGQASCTRGHNGIGGEGDGTTSGNGSGVVVMDSDVVTAIWGNGATNIKYAYIADQINFNSLSNYLATGE